MKIVLHLRIWFICLIALMLKTVHNSNVIPKEDIDLSGFRVVYFKDTKKILPLEANPKGWALKSVNIQPVTEIQKEKMFSLTRGFQQQGLVYLKQQGKDPDTGPEEGDLIYFLNKVRPMRVQLFQKSVFDTNPYPERTGLENICSEFNFKGAQTEAVAKQILPMVKFELPEEHKDLRPRHFYKLLFANREIVEAMDKVLIEFDPGLHGEVAEKMEALLETLKQDILDQMEDYFTHVATEKVLPDWEEVYPELQKKFTEHIDTLFDNLEEALETKIEQEYGQFLDMLIEHLKENFFDGFGSAAVTLLFSPRYFPHPQVLLKGLNEVSVDELAHLYFDHLKSKIFDLPEDYELNSPIEKTFSFVHEFMEALPNETNLEVVLLFDKYAAKQPYIQGDEKQQVDDNAEQLTPDAQPKIDQEAVHQKLNEFKVDFENQMQSQYQEFYAKIQKTDFWVTEGVFETVLEKFKEYIGHFEGLSNVEELGLIGEDGGFSVNSIVRFFSFIDDTGTVSKNIVNVPFELLKLENDRMVVI